MKYLAGVVTDKYQNIVMFGVKYDRTFSCFNVDLCLVSPNIAQDTLQVKDQKSNNHYLIQVPKDCLKRNGVGVIKDKQFRVIEALGKL